MKSQSRRKMPHDCANYIMYLYVYAVYHRCIFAPNFIFSQLEILICNVYNKRIQICWRSDSFILSLAVVYCVATALSSSKGRFLPACSGKYHPLVPSKGTCWTMDRLEEHCCCPCKTFTVHGGLLANSGQWHKLRGICQQILGYNCALSEK